MQIFPWLSWPQTRTLYEAFAPDTLRFVGGAVRDGLLGREVKDVDAATTLPPEETIQRLQEAGIKAIPTGIDHGTVTAVIDGKQFEITTLRHDVETDGRHAKVAYTQDWKEDAARRDFTMNALYCDASGRIFDYFGGQEDARGGRVRFIGDAAQRIEEDALRILRFFRFFAHYGQGVMDAQGLAASGAAAAKIDNLSGERIQQEMVKLLVSPRAAEIVTQMQDSKIWQYIVPVSVQTLVLAKLPVLLDKAKIAPSPWLAFAALLRVGSAQDKHALVENIAERWKLSNAHHRHLQALCAELGNISSEKEQKKHIRIMGKNLFIEHALLRMAEGWDEKRGLAAIILAQSWVVPQFPVSGDDLLAHGMAPGRQMGENLRKLEEFWEEKDYKPGLQELLAMLSTKH